MSTTSESQPPIGFFDLPPELRNRISTLVVRHEENGNVISPSGDTGGDGAIVCIDGKWHEGTLRDERPAPRDKFDLASLITSAAFGQPLPREEPGEEQPDLPVGHKHFAYKETKDCVYEGHVCDSTCLLAPPLTRVNRQLRSESLSLFYSVNTFRFMLDTILTDQSLALPSKYWRCIGDTNLRNITHFSVSSRIRTLQVIHRHDSAPDVHIRFFGIDFKLAKGVWSYQDPESKIRRPNTAAELRLRGLAEWVARGRVCVQTLVDVVEMLDR
ncbi:hypothetical protein LTR56_001793 [Elasticomyces elasticus]|nr:hypothetical protein LTR56_001793 [Elasticomyces elasticus]KAK3668857.1 hypothetical protein LTR22_000337 [Elasticomyces elasticus]KAK4924973.1 hypothetical protein LTR49_007979 [Elasticomyces elasticus]KAK5763230.1 hypothetical protein LTS12_006614 [Elasticomyces elasticus]